jgi:hypothetical protein
VLVGLAALGLLALAGYDSARFALSAARNQVAATAALHAADSGLDLYVRGVGPPEGPLAVEASPGSAVVSVVGLVALADSSRVVAVTSEGRARNSIAPPVIRRLVLLVRIDSTGQRHPVRGSWRERF